MKNLYVTLAQLIVGTNAKAHSKAKSCLFLLLYCSWMNLQPISLSKSNATSNFVDSTSAISAINAIQDCIPTQHYPDHADIISILQDVNEPIIFNLPVNMSKVIKTQKSFSELPFSGAHQVNFVLSSSMSKIIKTK
jgi:hypothetical protein